MRKIFAFLLSMTFTINTSGALAGLYHDPQTQTASSDHQYGPYSSTGLNRPGLPDGDPSM